MNQQIGGYRYGKNVCGSGARRGRNQGLRLRGEHPKQEQDGFHRAQGYYRQGADHRGKGRG